MTINRLIRYDNTSTLEGADRWALQEATGGSGGTATFVTGRTGTANRALRLVSTVNSQNYRKRYFAVANNDSAVTSCTVGFWGYLGGDKSASLSTALWPFFNFTSGTSSTRRIAVEWHKDNNTIRMVEVGGAATVYGTSSAFPTTLLQNWHYYEFHYTRDATNGRMRAWVDGELVISFDGDTTAGGTFSGYAFESFRVTSTDYLGIDFEDVYAGDEMASIGPAEILRFLPTSDIESEWTPSTGTDHYALVDEVPYTLTDYVSYNVAGSVQDVFGHNAASINNGRDIYAAGVQCVAEAQGTSPQWRSIWRISGTQYNGATICTSLTSGGVRSSQAAYRLNPNTNAEWTWTDIENAYIGVESLSSVQKRCHAVYGLVLASIFDPEIPTETETETPTPEFVTETETPTPEFVTETETPTPEFVTETETPTPEFVTETETPTPEFVTETETPTPEPETETPVPVVMKTITIMVMS